MSKKIIDLLILGAAVTLIIGIVSRILRLPFPFGIEAQAHLQFTHGLLLFAIALGLRELLRSRNKEK